METKKNCVFGYSPSFSFSGIEILFWVFEILFLGLFVDLGI